MDFDCGLILNLDGLSSLEFYSFFLVNYCQIYC